MGGEGNNHIAIKQGRIGRRGQWRCPIGCGFDRLAHGLIAVAFADLCGGNFPAGHLSDVDLAIDTGVRTGRPYPGALDACGDQRLILRQSPVGAGCIQMLLDL